LRSCYGVHIERRSACAGLGGLAELDLGVEREAEVEHPRQQDQDERQEQRHLDGDRSAIVVAPIPACEHDRS
jgi:hypothetical protein